MSMLTLCFHLALSSLALIPIDFSETSDLGKKIDMASHTKQQTWQASKVEQP